MIDRIRVVFEKEVIDTFRDRRTLIAALAAPLLGPLLMLLLFSLIGRQITGTIDRPLELPVAGAERAPALIQFLEQQNMVIRPAPADPRAAVRLGDEAVVLVIPETYSEQLRNGEPAGLQLVVDRSRQSSQPAVERTRRAIELYGQILANQRLLVRGISPSVVQPLALENVDVSTPQSQVAGLLNLMPYFMIFAIFIGGLYVAVDTTTGERERGSLEPLLVNPVPRCYVVLGKLGATLLFTLISVLVTLVAFWALLSLFPLGETLGIRFSLNTFALVQIFLLVLPMALLAAALQMVIATFVRGYREAQNYLGFLPLIPALPGMVLAFVPVRPALWNMLIPTFGQQLLINQFMRGEPVNPVHVVLVTTITLLVGVALVFVTVRLYERESVLFGKAS